MGKCVFFFTLVIFFLANTLKNSSAQEIQEVSGKYKGYNVILIILDALRPDHLSCYGYNKETSPNIDKLAKQGVLFKNTFSQASYTLPSVTSIFTSVYPYSHGVTHILKDKVPDKIDTLAQVLSGYGYNTAWFGPLDDPHTGSAPGLLKGFNEKCQLDPLVKSEDKEKMFEWIRAHRQTPFFLSMHSYSVHESFLPSSEFDNEFFKDIPKNFLDLMGNVDKMNWDTLKTESKKLVSFLGKDWVKKNLRHEYSKDDFVKLYSLATIKQKTVLNKINNKVIISLYRSFNDEQLSCFLLMLDSAIYDFDNKIVGRLIRELKELNLYDRTIIIITADHGNEFMEHGKFGHGLTLYDETIHVPLIYYIPHLNNTNTVKDFAQSIDISPTTLDLLGIKPPHQAQGISLIGLIEGRRDALKNEYVYCQGIPLGTLSIRSNGWKLFRKARESGEVKEKLFNLKKDPQESQDVYKDNPKIARQLKDCLDKWKKSLVVYQEGKDEFAPGISEETKERIKNTGYW